MSGYLSSQMPRISPQSAGCTRNPQHAPLGICFHSAMPSTEISASGFPPVDGPIAPSNRQRKSPQSQLSPSHLFLPGRNDKRLRSQELFLRLLIQIRMIRDRPPILHPRFRHGGELVHNDRYGGWSSRLPLQVNSCCRIRDLTTERNPGGSCPLLFCQCGNARNKHKNIYQAPKVYQCPGPIVGSHFSTLFVSVRRSGIRQILSPLPLILDLRNQLHSMISAF